MICPDDSIPVTIWKAFERGQSVSQIPSSAGPSADAPLGTLERGLAILSLFTAEKPSWTLREIVEESGLAKATTRRLALTLERLGWLEAEQDGQYVLGPQILQSLYAKTSATMLVKEARPHLERLAELTTETALIAAWGHDGPITLDLVSTPRHFKPFTSVGMVMRGLATADAQVLIAFSPESVWDARFDAIARYSPEVTEESRPRMKQQWTDIRRVGVALDREQWREGVCAVAAPILDATGTALASISIVMPSERADADTLQSSTDAVLAAAMTLSIIHGSP
jgi:IclR family pca regulon transcriptional regulator